MFWAEELYTFAESVGDALTMLETNSSFIETIGLTAFPERISDNLKVEIFESTLRFNGQPLNSSIEFVLYNGMQFGVGIIGKWKLIL